MFILVIDDEPAVAALIAEALEREGNQVAVAHSGDEGLTLLAQAPPDAVFLDLVMPGMEGLEVLRRIRTAHADLPVIIMSGWATEDRIGTAREYGATDIVRKPIALKNLVRAIDDLRRP